MKGALGDVLDPAALQAMEVSKAMAAAGASKEEIGKFNAAYWKAISENNNDPMNSNELKQYIKSSLIRCDCDYSYTDILIYNDLYANGTIKSALDALTKSLGVGL